MQQKPSQECVPQQPVTLAEKMFSPSSVRKIAGYVAGLVPLLTAAGAQDKPPSAPAEDYVKAHYTKYEFRIPMRDGVHLFTSVYVPKNDSQAWPILMDRTPYSVAPYGEDAYKTSLGPSDEFEKAGYIFVYQDVRGRYESEGNFVEMRPYIDIKSPDPKM
jgi:uncharacterized protein